MNDKNKKLNKIISEDVIVRLVRLNDEDVLFNKKRKFYLRADFDSYAVGRLIKFKDKTYFFDKFSKKLGTYYYFETLLDLQKNIEDKYVDMDKLVAVKAEPLADILTIKTRFKRRKKKSLKTNGLIFNFLDE